LFGPDVKLPGFLQTAWLPFEPGGFLLEER